MRAYGRQRMRGRVVSSEWVLLAKGLLKLLVVGMLIMSFREMALQLSSGEPRFTSAQPTATAPGDGDQPGSAPAPKVPVVSGPTEEDSEEVEAIQEEFQAVTDGTLQMGPEEMQAYDRLVRWSVNQPFNHMQQRARKDLVFSQFMQFPDKYRGKLVSLKLNVRRLLDADKNRDGTQLHEVWGWTTESKAWLYVAIVVDLPKGMPTGPDVYEKATLVGYFFKLQGYHEAGAKPNAPQLKAPLFIGRLTWQPAQPVKVSSNDWYWAMLAGGGLLLIMALQFGVGFLRKKRRGTAPLPAAGSTRGSRVPIEDWLNQAEAEQKHRRD